MSISFVRTLILYICVTIALRLMGKRQIGEFEPSELVITILVSELAAIPMQDMGTPLLSGVIPILTLVSLELVTSFACLKSRRLRRLLNGQPAVIIQGGRLDRKKMRDLRLTTDEVLEALRQNNISSVDEVQYGVIEPNGVLSYVLKPPYRPATAEMLGVTPENSGLPLIVISDGKPVLGNLKRLKIDLEDLNKRVRRFGLPSVSHVFLMTLDDCGNQFIQPKEAV